MSLQTLPEEIIDLVFDFVSDDLGGKARWRALISTALTCRQFRVPAQKRLFAKLDFFASPRNVSQVMSQIHQFQKALDAEEPDSSGKSRLASYIRTISISAAIHWFVVDKTLRNEALRHILQEIYRKGRHLRSLSISVTLTKRGTVKWTDLHEDLRDSVLGLCSSPLLTSLSLRGFQGLPSDILHKSDVRNLSVFVTGLKKQGRPKSSSSATGEVSSDKRQRDYTPIESLDFDHSCSILWLLDATVKSSTPPALIFHSLKRFSSEVRQLDHLKATASILSNAPALQELVIRLADHGLCKTALDLAPFANLKSFTLKSAAHYLPKAPSPDFPDICFLLANCNPPSNLQNIDITLDSRESGAEDTIATTFSRPNFNPLKETLSHPRFHHVESITVRITLVVRHHEQEFNTRRYREQAQAYIREEKFTDIPEETAKSLNIVVSVSATVFC